MNYISNKVYDKVTQVVEWYCKDKGIKEIEPQNIFDAKPDLKYVYEVPCNLNYERHYGPVQGVRFSPFHSWIFLSASVDGSVKMFD